MTAPAPPPAVRSRRWKDRIGSPVNVVGAAAVALVLGAGVIAVAGGNPITAYADIVTGTFGSRSTITLMLGEVTPLLLIGLGLAIAFQGRVWNIGAEGQYLVGAVVGGAFAILSPVQASVVLIPAALLVGTAAGAAWGWIVGKFQAVWGVNEVISSLLLNYVAIFGVAYLVRQPLRDPDYYLPQSKLIPSAARLPDLPFLDVHAGLLIGLIFVPVVIYAMGRTPFGFKVRVLGMNRDAARAAGIDTNRLIVKVMMISGGFAGLAGIAQVLGVESRLNNNLDAGYGFTAIITALLGRMRPLGIVLSSVFIATITVGGDIVQRSQQVPRAAVFVLQALFVIVLLVADKLARR